ncbi:NUDIX hydrolase [Allokutzneria oryzae]|uniref:NUDIX hydrolase n=1 Tax=Allokutzneria oryzae TaxID=1378989 RepID=A0ABV5ZTC9_9PSEU
MTGTEVLAAFARRAELVRAVLAGELAVEPSYARALGLALDRAAEATGEDWVAAQNELTSMLSCVDRTRIPRELWRRLAESERELIGVLPTGLDRPELVDPDLRYEPRLSARVLLADADDRVLLFRGHAPEWPDIPFWFTVGGGIDPGEDPRAGAARELREETGLEAPADELVGPVWVRRGQFTFAGVPTDSVELFFVLRSRRGWEIDTSGFTELELDTIERHRWWTASELAAARERVYPYQLRELLPGLLGGVWDGVTRTVH